MTRTYPRKLGRYSASDLYKMLESANIPWGLKPEDFFKLEAVNFEGAYRMRNGVIYHELVQEFLTDCDNEVKKEYEYKTSGPLGVEETHFVVVAKADSLPRDRDEVWEIKTSEGVIARAKPWQEHQAKLYCSIFGRSLARILQPVVDRNRLILREVGLVNRDDEWFAQEMRRLHNYHERLVLLNSQN